MDVGLAIFPTAERSDDEPAGRGRCIRPDVLARAAEERGYESLFFTEHTHIPTSRESPWPGGNGPRVLDRALYVLESGSEADVLASIPSL